MTARKERILLFIESLSARWEKSAQFKLLPRRGLGDVIRQPAWLSEVHWEFQIGSLERCPVRRQWAGRG